MGHFSNAAFASNHFRANYWGPQQQQVQPPVVVRPPYVPPPQPVTGGGGDGVVVVVVERQDKTVSAIPAVLQLSATLSVQAFAVEDYVALEAPEQLQEAVAAAPAPQAPAPTEQAPEPALELFVDGLPNVFAATAACTASVLVQEPEQVQVAMTVGLAIGLSIGLVAVPAETRDTQISCSATPLFSVHAKTKTVLEFSVAADDMFSATDDDDFSVLDTEDLKVDD